MAKTEKEKKSNSEKPLTEKNKIIKTENPEAEDGLQPFSTATDSLMPELEELVKKNPNRLIGCGG